MAKIAIVVDNPFRDLPSCVLLASTLVEKGNEVVLVPFYECRAFIYKILPDVIVLNYARTNNIGLIKDCKNLGIKISVLDTEGGVFGSYEEADSNDYLQTVIGSDETRGMIDHYYVWGKKLYKELADKEIYNEKQLRLTGTPRFDFYQSEYSRFLDSQSCRHHVRGNKYLLVTSSFPMVNPKYQTVEKEKEMMINTFNYERSYVENLFDKLKKAQTKYCKNIIEASRSFDNGIQIVFRPHPFEEEDFYEEFFKDYDNVKVIKDGVIGEWLNAGAFAMIHFESTTCFEAAFSGVPSFAYNEFTEIWNIKEIQKATDYQNSIVEMNESLRKAFNQNYHLPEKIQQSIKEMVESIYFKLDGKSNERVANEILSLCNEDIIHNKTLAKILLFREKTKFIIKKITGRLPNIEAKKFKDKEVIDIFKRIGKETVLKIEEDPLFLEKYSLSPVYLAKNS